MSSFTPNSNKKDNDEVTVNDPARSNESKETDSDDKKLCIIIFGDDEFVKEGELRLNVNIASGFLQEGYCVALLIDCDHDIDKTLKKDIKDLFSEQYREYVFPIHCDLESKDSINDVFNKISNKKIPVAMIYNPIYRHNSIHGRNVTTLDLFDAAVKYYKIGYTAFKYCVDKFIHIGGKNVVLPSNQSLQQTEHFKSMKSVEDEFKGKINFTYIKHTNPSSIESSDESSNKSSSVKLARNFDDVKAGDSNTGSEVIESSDSSNLDPIPGLEEYIHVHIKWIDEDDNDRVYYIVAHKRNETSAFYQLQLRDNDEMQNGRHNAWILGRADFVSNYLIGFEEQEIIEIEQPNGAPIIIAFTQPRFTRVVPSSGDNDDIGFVFCSADSVGSDSRGNQRWRLMPSIKHFGKYNIRSRIRNSEGIPMWMAINRTSTPKKTVRTIRQPDEPDLANFIIEKVTV